MHAFRFTRFVVVLGAGLIAGAVPGIAATECLSDEDLGVIVRSVFTRSIGRVMRTCATQYPALDERARDAATGFLTSYSEDMRANRLAANSVMMRVHGEAWRETFEKTLVETTASDEMRARQASQEDCEREIARIETMVAAEDYRAVMAEGLPRGMFDAERARIPVCP